VNVIVNHACVCGEQGGEKEKVKCNSVREKMYAGRKCCEEGRGGI